MKWVDPVMCDNCESPCNRRESAEPYPFEKARAAGRVETYVCREEGCGGGARFPRYNDPAMLLQTRTGRCGEYLLLQFRGYELISRGICKLILSGPSCSRVEREICLE